MKRRIFWLLSILTLVCWAGCADLNEDQNYRINEEQEPMFQERSPTQGRRPLDPRAELARANGVIDDAPIDAPTIDDPDDLVRRAIADSPTRPTDAPTLDDPERPAIAGDEPIEAPLQVETVIFVDKEGRLLVNQQYYDIKTLQELLRDATRDTPNAYVSLRVDHRLESSQIKPILRALADAGMHLVNLVSVDGDHPERVVAGLDRANWPTLVVRPLDGSVRHHPVYLSNDSGGRSWVLRDRRKSPLGRRLGDLEGEGLSAVTVASSSYNPNEIMNMGTETVKLGLDILALPINMIVTPPWTVVKGKVNNDLPYIDPMSQPLLGAPVELVGEFLDLGAGVLDSFDWRGF